MDAAGTVFAGLGTGAENPQVDEVANDEGTGADALDGATGVGDDSPHDEDVENDDGGLGRDACSCRDPAPESSS